MLGKRKTMVIMKCPHTNQKHYAKVSIISITWSRVCAIIVTISMEEIALLTPALTVIDLCMQKGNAKTATLTTTINKREE